MTQTVARSENAKPDAPEPERRDPAPRSGVSSPFLRAALVIAMMLGDTAAAFLAVVVAYHIRFVSGWMTVVAVHPWEPYFAFGVIFAICTPIVFTFQKLYRFLRSASRIDELYKTFAGCSITLLVAIAASVITYRDLDYSRAVLPLTWILAIVFIWAQRFVQYRIHNLLRSRGVSQERLLVVGAGEVASIILQKVKASPRLGYTPVGVLCASTPTGESFWGVPVLGPPSAAGAIAKKFGVTELIIADPTLTQRDILDIVDQCERQRINIRVFPDVFQIIASEVSINDFEGLPLVSIRDAQLRGWNLAVKRAVDIVISATVLVLISPVMLFTAALIKLFGGPGPVFHVQERVGLDNKPFMMLKFRSMRTDAEVETGPVWAQKDDPRRTKLGAFMRRFSIDELPQFINVLLGEMSLVGPRP
ncbi:MAG: sugar transferase, partial [Dehalococcoidia bacterium]|nr:sugar transferase [Dehalococcoidia bacterium]